jgi:hypothetical protein
VASPGEACEESGRGGVEENAQFREAVPKLKEVRKELPTLGLKPSDKVGQCLQKVKTDPG